jgi:hypothetical protein
LSQRKNAFDGVMQKIEPKKIKQDSNSAGQKKLDDTENNFFTGNVGSLLDAVSDVDRIEIKKNRQANFLNEEISFTLK